MFRSVVLVMFALSSASAFAQDPGPLRQPYITGTGETVPKPGASHLHKIKHLNHRERRDDKTDSSICKGC